MAAHPCAASSLPKNKVFQQAAGCGTRMCRHFCWLQAIESVSHLKTALPDLEVQMSRRPSLFAAQHGIKIPPRIARTRERSV